MELLDSPEKAAVIAGIADDYPDIHTFVETGTAAGEQAFHLREDFLEIVTIEMDFDLYYGAMNRLLPYSNIRVLFADAGRQLPLLLKHLDRPCVIFLDAHEIADAGHASMAEEMMAIDASPHEHVVLVDDVRLCNGQKGWLTEDQLIGYARTWDYDYVRTDDIARLTP